MGSLTNSKDPDEMPQNVAFHQGMHYNLQELKYIIVLKFLPVTP